MKRLLFTLTLIFLGLTQAEAVLKERDLEQTLEILRVELTEYHRNLSEMTAERKKQNEAIINQLVETMKQSNQNQLMLYSQKHNYVFDLTYACHQATEQYNNFKRSQIPFKKYLASTEDEIAKYDSLIYSLKNIPENMLGERISGTR